MDVVTNRTVFLNNTPITNMKLILILAGILFCNIASAQTQEELERQRQELKKELDQTQKLLNQNKSKHKENLVQWRLINEKVNLQNKMVTNINREVRSLNDNIYILQKEINLYNRILDTLKRDYAKSMVYTYENRNNTDFLNFILSAENFNDAIKRIAYLRSYRNYREMQGANILRTQEQRQKKIDDISKLKSKKSETLTSQKKELAQLADEQKEKDRILAELNKKSKDLNKQLANKKAQMNKVNKAIAAAIKKAKEEAIRIAKAKEAEEKRKRDLAAKEAGKTSTVEAPKDIEPVAPRKTGESVLLNSENIALNASFEKNRGQLPWPVDKGLVLMKQGNNKLPSGTNLYNPGLTIASDIGTPVKSVFNGVVLNVVDVDNMKVVMIQHGRYFISYSNITSVTVKAGDQVTTGKTIGKVAATLDGIGAIDFIISDEKADLNPESWLRRM